MTNKTATNKKWRGCWSWQGCMYVDWLHGHVYIAYYTPHTLELCYSDSLWN